MRFWACNGKNNRYYLCLHEIYSSGVDRCEPDNHNHVIVNHCKCCESKDFCEIIKQENLTYLGDSLKDKWELSRQNLGFVCGGKY